MILVLNCGSSSVKYKVFLVEGDSLQPAARGIVERIGTSEARVRHADEQGEVDRAVSAGDHSAALEVVAGLVGGGPRDARQIRCVAHRVVHGGRISQSAVRIDDEVIREITACADLAPLHNPANLAGINAARALFGTAHQVAVLDTAFHQTMPEAAFLYALPYEFYERHGIRRFGFHGISHLYVSRRAADLAGKEGGAARRLVSCHLGAGSSVTAVLDGRSVDTSMGFTPLEGLIMATRCGDVDPAVPLFMAEKLGMSIREIDQVLNRSSGLLGISGSSADVRDLLDAASSGHRRSALAIEMFCYRVGKYVGAYAAAMAGLDALVFTAGIGENSPEVRSSVCSRLGFLGVRLDEEKNYSTTGGVEGAINKADAPVGVFVIPTDEEMVMAQEAWRLVSAEAAGAARDAE